jgi:hypothetical protein
LHNFVIKSLLTFNCLPDAPEELILSQRRALISIGKLFLALVLILNLFSVLSGGAHTAYASGSTWTVNSLGYTGATTCSANAGSGGPTCELGDALNKAQNGDAIQFSVIGTITLSGTLFVGTNVNINGPGVNALTISGNNVVQVFQVSSTVTAASINNLSITNGYGFSSYFCAGGGGICNFGTLAITNVIFSGNSASGTYGGGGIFNNGGTLTVANSTFSGNMGDASGAYGGAIFNYSISA